MSGVHTQAYIHTWMMTHTLANTSTYISLEHYHEKVLRCCNPWFTPDVPAFRYGCTAWVLRLATNTRCVLSAAWCMIVVELNQINFLWEVITITMYLSQCTYVMIWKILKSIPNLKYKENKNTFRNKMQYNLLPTALKRHTFFLCCIQINFLMLAFYNEFCLSIINIHSQLFCLFPG